MKTNINYGFGLSPLLLKSSYFDGYNIKGEIKFSPRKVFDYEFDYYIKSDGGIMIDGIYTPFQKGEINIRKPGQIVCGVGKYCCYILAVSFSGEKYDTGDYMFGCKEKTQALSDNDLLVNLPKKIILKNHLEIEQIIKRINILAKRTDELSIFQRNMELYRFLLNIFMTSSADSTILRNKKIDGTIKYIYENFCDEVSESELIEISKLSKSCFHKQFKKLTGTTPKKLILFLRVEKAKDLLLISDISVQEIAGLCGFYDNVYFSYIFKRETGFRPTQFRNKY